MESINAGKLVVLTWNMSAHFHAPVSSAVAFIAVKSSATQPTAAHVRVTAFKNYSVNVGPRRFYRPSLAARDVPNAIVLVPGRIHARIHLRITAIPSRIARLVLFWLRNVATVAMRYEFFFFKFKL